MLFFFFFFFLLIANKGISLERETITTQLKQPEEQIFKVLPVQEKWTSQKLQNRGTQITRSIYPCLAKRSAIPFADLLVC